MGYDCMLVIVVYYELQGAISKDSGKRINRHVDRRVNSQSPYNVGVVKSRSTRKNWGNS